ncbi:MAG: laccase domain-containing protein, partial [Ancrocorticia sp.]|uniref:laccase domain-containing protein n=1 Tax=Ancrocorticia sp. TaxID=2593684 RepID=UPI003F925534
ESTIAVLGPSICGGCYEVPEHMAAAAGQVEPSAVSQTRWGTPSIDIPRGLRAQLERSGVSQIVDAGVCTRESEDYFSHRHASASGQPTGRFVGVVHVMGDSPADCGDTPAQPHGAGGEGLIP